MCKIMQEYENKARDEGISIGEARGEARGISIGEARGEARGISIGRAEERKNLLDQMLAAGMITPEQAKQLAN